ncbi:MAG: glycosyltransferase [Gammaproteobacteria bacterium]
MQKIKILWILPSLAGGGAERVIVTLLRHLDRDRYQPVLAVVNMRNAVYLDDLPEDVKLLDLKCKRVRYALPKILWLIRKQRPDIVFSTLGHLNLAIALLKPLLPKRTHFVAREASVVSKVRYLHRWPRLVSWLYRCLYRRFDLIICQSQPMLDDLLTTYGLPQGKAVVVPNPIDVELVHKRSLDKIQLLGFDQNRFNVVVAGRLSHEKGLDILLEAVAMCGDIPVNVVILGEGTLRPVLENQALVLGVRNRVKFIGFQPNPYPYFAHADLFVLSSYVEGFPNVVMEALICGTPVVATPCAEVLTQILADGVNGWLAARINAGALAEVLRSAVSLPRQTPRQQALEARFGVGQIILQYQKLLEDRHRVREPSAG